MCCSIEPPVEEIIFNPTKGEVNHGDVVEIPVQTEPRHLGQTSKVKFSLESASLIPQSHRRSRQQQKERIPKDFHHNIFRMKIRVHPRALRSSKSIVGWLRKTQLTPFSIFASFTSTHYPLPITSQPTDRFQSAIAETDYAPHQRAFESSSTKHCLPL